MEEGGIVRKEGREKKIMVGRKEHIGGDEEGKG